MARHPQVHQYAHDRLLTRADHLADHSPEAAELRLRQPHPRAEALESGLGGGQSLRVTIDTEELQRFIQGVYKGIALKLSSWVLKDDRSGYNEEQIIERG